MSNADRANSAQKDRADDARWQCSAFDSLGKDVERNGRSAELATEKTGAATVLVVEKTAAASQLEACKNTAALNLTIEKTAAAAALLAMQNKMDSDAKAAACCCELKEAIGADGQKTRDLINQMDRERLQARVVALERLLPVAI